MVHTLIGIALDDENLLRSVLIFILGIALLIVFLKKLICKHRLISKAHETLAHPFIGITLDDESLSLFVLKFVYFPDFILIDAHMFFP